MNKIKSLSGTHTPNKRQLPALGLKSSRVSQAPHSQSYLSNFSKDLCENVEYTDMNEEKLNREQRRLQHILKKINSDTFELISGFSSKPKKARTHHRTATILLAVNAQEQENNSKILQRCQDEMEALRARAS